MEKTTEKTDNKKSIKPLFAPPRHLTSSLSHNLISINLPKLDRSNYILWLSTLIPIKHFKNFFNALKTMVLKSDFAPNFPHNCMMFSTKQSPHYLVLYTWLINQSDNIEKVSQTKAFLQILSNYGPCALILNICRQKSMECDLFKSNMHSF